MSSRYAALANLKTGVDNYKIKVRVIRKWRGATKTGEEFKNFNILLLDNKVSTIKLQLKLYDLTNEVVL